MIEEKLKKKMKDFMDENEDIVFMHCIAKTDINSEDDYLIVMGADQSISHEVANVAKNLTKVSYKELKAGKL